jgi:hypothetical protein
MARSSATRHWSAGNDLLLLLLLTGSWLFPWAVLTAAAWAAGGRPTVNPIAFVEPGQIVARLGAQRPFALWHLVGGFGPANPFVFWTVLCTLCAMALSSALVITSRLPHLMGVVAASRSGGVDRLSRWARHTDLRGVLTRRMQPGRFLIGYHRRDLMATEREVSTLVIGPTRSGKTACLVIPNLFEWEGPAIVTSTKSELVDITAGHRQTVGPVYVYDPGGEVDDRYTTVTWSPLVGCEDLDRAWMVASWLCAGLQQGSARGDGDWAHWAESGKLLIAPLLFAAASTEQTIVDVRTWIHGFDLATPLAIIESLLFQGEDATADDATRDASMLASIDRRP